MSELQRSEFLYAYREEVPQSWHLQPHVHSHHELVIVVGGSQRAQFLGRTETSGPAFSLFFPAGQAHEQWAIRKPKLQ